MKSSRLAERIDNQFETFSKKHNSDEASPRKFLAQIKRLSKTSQVNASQVSTDVLNGNASSSLLKPLTEYKEIRNGDEPLSLRLGTPAVSTLSSEERKNVKTENNQPHVMTSSLIENGNVVLESHCQDKCDESCSNGNDDPKASELKCEASDTNLLFLRTTKAKITTSKVRKTSISFSQPFVKDRRRRTLRIYTTCQSIVPQILTVNNKDREQEIFLPGTISIEAFHYVLTEDADQLKQWLDERSPKEVLAIVDLTGRTLYHYGALSKNRLIKQMSIPTMTSNIRMSLIL
ncbi:hypothetical protein Plhal304r1_c006g0024361 [Plasmopara halstedii]